MTADGRARARAAAAVLGAAVGASIWLSAGVLALVEPIRLTRVAAVPGWEWLAGLALGGAAIGVLVPAIRAAWPPATLLALLWLPWLPIRVPNAFLLWEGPLERAVWAAVIAGAAWMLRPRTAPSWARPWFLGPRAPWVAALLSAIIFGLAWASVRPRVPTGDEPHYLVITQSLLRDGDLRIENNHQTDQYQEYLDGVLKPDFRRRGTNGQIYSIHAPGVPVLVAPAFAAFGYAGAVGVVIAVVSLGLAAAWQAAFLLTGSAAAAWIGWASITCSAPLLLHGFTIYPDGPAAAATMLGLLGLVWLAVARPPRVAVWTAVGAALATLPWLHTRFIAVAGMLGLVLCLRLVHQPLAARGAIARLLAVPAVAAAGWFLYFWTIYGTPDPSAPYGGTESAVRFVPVGLSGLLADQQFGLVANAPVLGVGLLGLTAMARRRPRLSIELAAILTVYLAAVATYPMWWGGTSAPGRFAVIVLPLLAVPIAEWWAASTSARPAIVALLAVSAGISLALAGIDGGAFVFNGRDGYDLLLDWLSPTVDLTLAAPSVHRDGAAVALMDAAVWLAATAVLASGAAWLTLARPRWAVTRAASFAAVPLAIMLATTVVWASAWRPVLTPPTSQLAFLDRWSPQRLRVALQIVPSRGLSAADVPRRLTLGTTTRGPRPAGEAMLVLPRVLAGDYDVFVEGRAPLEGTLAVRLGRQSTLMDEWSLAGRHVGFTGLTLSLPAAAHSIAITGDDAARQSVEALTLKPRVVAPPERSLHSLRAARFGRVVVFALDDNAYFEPSALWIRGEQDARFVVRADAGAAPVLRLDGGAVPNVVTVSSGAWRAQVTLAPGGTADVRVPQEALAPAELTVRSATGFRPRDHAADSHDGRFLGVYVTWPDAPP